MCSRAIIQLVVTGRVVLQGYNTIVVTGRGVLQSYNTMVVTDRGVFQGDNTTGCNGSWCAPGL